MTIVPAANAAALSEDIFAIRARFGFTECDLLKSSSSSKPEHCTVDQHRQAKNATIEAVHKNCGTFIGYAKFNRDNDDPIRNRVYGYHSLLEKFDKFLKNKKSYGSVIFDNLEWSRSEEFGRPRDFITEKFQRGLTFDKKKTWKRLAQIVSYSMTHEGTSNLLSANDILTGSLRYVANGPKDGPRVDLIKSLHKCLWHDEKGVSREFGLILRPKGRDKLPKSIQAEYDALRFFMNKAVVGDSAEDLEGK